MISDILWDFGSVPLSIGAHAGTGTYVIGAAVGGDYVNLESADVFEIATGRPIYAVMTVTTAAGAAAPSTASLRWHVSVATDSALFVAASYQHASATLGLAPIIASSPYALVGDLAKGVQQVLCLNPQAIPLGAGIIPIQKGLQYMTIVLEAGNTAINAGVGKFVLTLDPPAANAYYPSGLAITTTDAATT
jgi:hypothetical protein